MTLTSILEAVDFVVIIGATRTIGTSSVTGVALIVVLISAWTACALSLVNKVLHKNHESV